MNITVFLYISTHSAKTLRLNHVYFANYTKLYMLICYR